MTDLDLLLPDSDLTPELLTFAQQIRAFATRELQPHARAVDEQRVFRRETVAALGAAGILRGPLSREHGGSGWTPLQIVLAYEEIGAVCGNARGFATVQSGLVASLLAAQGTDAQRARWLPGLLDGSAIGCFALTEPEAGSDVGALGSLAERQGDGFVLRGEKHWITNGGVADVALLFVNADPGRGKDGITAFVCPTGTPGLRREPMPGVELGHRGSDHARLLFQDLRLPADAVLGGAAALGRGFKAAMAGLNVGRLSVAAGAVGIHRAAAQAAAVFCRDRAQFGRPLAAFQMVQERLADLVVELHAARGLVRRCAERRLAGSEGHADLAMAKLYATEAAARACDVALQLHGARGYSSAFPVERLLRDIQGLRIYEGTSLIQKTIIARALLPR